MDEERFANWYTEIRISQTGFEVSRKISAMLVQRLGFGSAVIVCSKPRNMHPVFRKRWLHILRLLENERAATRSAVTKREMKVFEEMLTAVPFLVGQQPEEVTMPCVWLLEADDLNNIPAGVATVFVMSDLSMAQLLHWARRLGDDGALVVFRRQLLPVSVEPPA